MSLMRGGRTRNRNASCFVHGGVNGLLTGSARVSAIVLNYARFPLLLPGVRRCVPSNVAAIARKRLMTSDLGSCLRHRPRVSGGYAGNKEYICHAARSRRGFARSTSAFLGRSVEIREVRLWVHRRWALGRGRLLCLWSEGLWVRAVVGRRSGDGLIRIFANSP